MTLFLGTFIYHLSPLKIATNATQVNINQVFNVFLTYMYLDFVSVNHHNSDSDTWRKGCLWIMCGWYFIFIVCFVSLDLHPHASCFIILKHTFIGRFESRLGFVREIAIYDIKLSVSGTDYAERTELNLGKPHRQFINRHSIDLYRWLSERLQHLQFVSNGVTAVLC